MIRLDTHVAVWLYAGETERFTASGIAVLEGEELVISPIVALEVTYLHEIGRLTVSGPSLVADLRERIGLKASEQNMASVVAAAHPLTWTRDPFDRLIVGDAAAAGSGLLTKDTTILGGYPLAQW